MKQLAGLLIVGLVAAGSAPMAGAVEQKEQAMEHHPTSTSQSSASPTASAQLASAAQSSMIQGSISTLDLKSTPPMLKLNAADGKVRVFTLDLKTTSVWKDGQMSQLDQLKPGQSVRVKHATVRGTDMAQSIRIVSGAKPVASAIPSKSHDY